MSDRKEFTSIIWKVIIPIFVVTMVIVAWRFCWFQQSTTIFVVRHADKVATGADDISSIGLARANELVHVLGSAEITAVYHSNTIRAEKTAQPLASANCYRTTCRGYSS